MTAKQAGAHAQSENRYLTREEAGQRMRVSTRLVDKWCRANALRSIRVGRRVLFDKADLDQFYESSKTPAVPAGA